MAETKKPNFAELLELIDSEGLSALELILPLADERTLIELQLNGFGQFIREPQTNPYAAATVL
jgi:hypothetical protein